MFEMIDSITEMPSGYSSSDYSENNRKLFQDHVDESFEFANNYYSPDAKDGVKEEIERGSLLFEGIGVRVDSVISSGTGIKLGTDYRKLIFKEKNLKNYLGQRYKFKKNTWITTNTGEVETATYSATIRRCNSTLNFYTQPETKKGLYKEPCIIDYGSSDETLEKKGNVILPNRRIHVIVQYNKYTEDIKINNRFILGRQAFKVIGMEDYLNLNTNIDNPGLITFVMELDDLSEQDDLVKRVAIGTNEIDETVSPIGVLSVYKKKEKEKEKEIIYIDSKDNNKTEEKTPENNPPIVEEPEPIVIKEESETLVLGNFTITPNQFIIKEGQYITYKIENQGHNISGTALIKILSNIPEHCYEIEQNSTNIRIMNNQKFLGEPLILRISKNLEYVDLKIVLKGRF